MANVDATLVAKLMDKRAAIVRGLVMELTRLTANKSKVARIPALVEAIYNQDVAETVAGQYMDGLLGDDSFGDFDDANAVLTGLVCDALLQLGLSPAQCQAVLNR